MLDKSLKSLRYLNASKYLPEENTEGQGYSLN